jgi:peptidoglycan/LPS O-acetylase OafA/YrhL
MTMVAVDEPLTLADRTLTDGSIQKTRHYLALDGLRGVAAVSVACLHICLYFRLPFSPYHAYLAVDFFFLLSGVVVAHAYDRHLRSHMSIWKFLTIRLIRVHPLALLGIGLGASVFLMSARGGSGISSASVLQAAVTNALFLPSPAMTYLRPWAFPLDTPLWSLSIEIWVNALYASCIKFLNRGSLILTILLGAILVCWVAIRFNGLDAGYAWPSFYAGGARVLFPFTLGIFMSRFLIGRISRSRWTHAAWLPLAIILCAPAFLPGYYDILAVLLAFPAIVLVAAHAGPSRRLDGLWQQLGQISYPLYVLQYPVILVISNLAKTHHLEGSTLMAAAFITLLAVLTIAWLANRFYDIPVRRFLTSRLVPGRVQPA